MIYLVRPLGLYSLKPLEGLKHQAARIATLSLSVTEYLDCGESSRQLIESASSLVTTSPRVLGFLKKNALLSPRVLAKLCLLSERSYGYYEAVYSQNNCQPQFVGDGTIGALASFLCATRKIGQERVSKTDAQKEPLYLRGETVSFNLAESAGISEMIVYRNSQIEAPLLEGVSVTTDDIDFNAYFAFYSGSAVRFFDEMFARQVKAIAFGPSSEKELLDRGFHIYATSSIKDEAKTLKQALSE